MADPANAPGVSSGPLVPISVFDILHFIIVRRIQFLHWRHPDGDPDPRELASDPVPAIAWRPEELRAYHDDLCR